MRVEVGVVVLVAVLVHAFLFTNLGKDGGGRDLRGMAYDAVELMEDFGVA